MECVCFVSSSEDTQNTLNMGEKKCVIILSREGIFASFYSSPGGGFPETLESFSIIIGISA